MIAAELAAQALLVHLIEGAIYVVLKRLWIVVVAVVAAVLGVLGHPGEVSNEYFSAIAQVIPVLFIAGIVETKVATPGAADPLGVLQYGAMAAIGEASALAAIAYASPGRISAVLFWITSLALIVFMVSVVRRPVAEHRGVLNNQVHERTERIERLRAAGDFKRL
jgi:hypothetical protein